MLGMLGQASFKWLKFDDEMYDQLHKRICTPEKRDKYQIVMLDPLSLYISDL